MILTIKFSTKKLRNTEEEEVGEPEVISFIAEKASLSDREPVRTREAPLS